MDLTAHCESPMAIFDTLGANGEKPYNKNQTLFFGIPKGTFYKKSPWAGHGAEPHIYGFDSALRVAYGDI